MRHAAACAGRHPATRNELRPFPGQKATSCCSCSCWYRDFINVRNRYDAGHWQTAGRTSVDRCRWRLAASAWSLSVRIVTTLKRDIDAIWRLGRVVKMKYISSVTGHCSIFTRNQSYSSPTSPSAATCGRASVHKSVWLASTNHHQPRPAQHNNSPVSEESACRFLLIDTTNLWQNIDLLMLFPWRSLYAKIISVHVPAQ